MPSKTSTKAAEEKPPKDDPLATYLQIAREGDADAGSAIGRFWIGSLTEGGRCIELYAKTKAEVEERARAILAARGIDVS